MAKAIAVPIRHEIIERHQQGETLAAIAGSLSLSYWGVRQIWRRYRDRGEAGLALRGEGRLRRGFGCERLIYRSALWLKRHHRGWGAGLIRVVLRQRYQALWVPHERTLQRWFRQQHLNPLREQHPPVTRERAQQVHQVWQLDATSHQQLADGTPASWISLIDEHSGALLQSEVFPPLRL